MPRILIVRLSAVGDVIHGLPVASALRDAYPESWIGWVVEGRAGDLLEGHPDLDQVIRVPRRWLKSARTVWQVRRELRALEIDVTVDLQCLTKSAVMAWLSGASRRLGVGGDDGRELSKWLNNELTLLDAPHVVEHYLGILKPLGIETPAVRFVLPEHDQERRFAERLLEQYRLESGEFVVLNPGAGWPSKIWPAERYGVVARWLAEHRQLSSLVVWGDPAEQSLAEAIVNASGGKAVLAPATTLRELAAVSRRARLFIGSDTGPLHLAVAVGAPSISLHGASRADWCGAYGPESRALQAVYADGTARQRRSADNQAMQAISVDMVLEACRDLLGPAAGRRCG